MTARRALLQSSGLLALGATALAAKAAETTSAASGERYRVVFHISDSETARWNLALGNAKNVQADLGAANVDIEMVVLGPGIGMAKLDSPVYERVSESIKAGIRFAACENTMHSQKLSKEDMHPDIGYVHAGVVEIIKRQREGWAYLRP